jgi:hypothetical protein
MFLPFSNDLMLAPFVRFYSYRYFRSILFEKIRLKFV